MNHLTLQLASLNELPDAADLLLTCFPDQRVFAFEGQLGAGKTTLIKALCTHLGVNDAMSSPSFALVNEYATSTGIPVFHFDLYRMKSTGEALDIGFEEYVWSGNYCLIEWPELAKELLPENTVWITLTLTGETRLLVAE